VRESSSYWTTLRALLAEGAGFELHAAPEQQETEEIIGRVAGGEYDLTLADSHIVAIELAHRDDIQVGVTLGDPIQHGWAMRPSNPGLIAAINAFWKKEYRGLVYNMTANKYFKNDRKMKSHAVHRSGTRGEISSYDDPTRRHAAKHGFDARLILAQMYQESRFNPNARSFAGALGLLQVMPRTAKELGIGADQLAEPEVGIETGVRYLSWVRGRFSEQLPSAERTWFSLAAYNVGPGHVRDARKLAKQRGLDPDQWFDNVEVAMLSKEDPQVHRSTRYGYCRGSEPVRYVREIRDRYRAYLEVAGAGSAPTE
jgi:membrane-bound lytic murein transglycosylase F